VYVIGGFNHEEHICDKVERFCWESKVWESLEPINIPRINGSATKCGMKYVYLFGGLSSQRNEFSDQIERYNTELQIWTVLSIRLPLKLSNSFAFSFSDEFILIMGGITKKEPTAMTS